MAGPIRIAILANASQAKSELASTATAAQKIEGKFSKFRGPAIAAIGGIALLTKAVVTSASASQQSLGATETVFGKYAGSVIRNSQKAANEVGLSANAYRENANLIGSLFKNQGVASDELAGKTHAMVKAGADLAATFGGTTREAVEALGAAYKGEFDPLEKYGISIKQSSINAELAARGQDKLTGAALKQATQMATTDLIMRQSKDSLGTFARESNTLAGQQQRLGAKFENLKSTMGTALLPVFTKLAEVASKFSDWAAAHPQILEGVIIAIGALATVVLAASAATAIQTAATTLWAVVTGTARVAVMAWTAAQWLLNAALTANPIGLVVLAIVALVAVFVLAWQKSETFRNIVIGAWNAIQAATVAVWNFIKTLLATVWEWISTAITTYFNIYKTIILAVWNAVGAVTSAVWNAIKSVVTGVVNAVKSVISTVFGSLAGIVSAAWNAIKNGIGAAWAGIKSAVSTAVDTVLGVIRGIKDRIIGVFSGAIGWLRDAGKNIILGLINGIGDMARAAADKAVSVVKGAISAAGHALGLGSPSRVFRKIGEQTIQGLIDGLQRKAPKVQRTMRSMMANMSDFTATVNGKIDLTAVANQSALTLAPAAAAPTSNTYNITIQAPVGSSSVDIGRTLTEHINAYERAGGRRRA